MKITRTELFQASQLAILEMANDMGEGHKTFVLEKMTHKQAFNVIFNPDKKVVEEQVVLENHVVQLVRIIEESKRQLIEKNSGKKLSSDQYLKEFLTLLEQTKEDVKKSMFRRAGEKAGAAAEYVGGKFEGDPTKPGIVTKTAQFFDPRRSEILKGVHHGTSEFTRGYMGDKAVDKAKKVAKYGGLAVAGGAAGLTGLALYKWLQARKRKKAMNQAQQMEPQMQSAVHESLQVGTNLAARTMGYVACLNASASGSSPTLSCLNASLTLEALSKFALAEGDKYLHIVSLHEAKKWIGRAYHVE